MYWLKEYLLSGFCTDKTHSTGGSVDSGQTSLSALAQCSRSVLSLSGRVSLAQCSHSVVRVSLAQYSRSVVRAVSLSTLNSVRVFVVQQALFSREGLSTESALETKVGVFSLHVLLMLM